MTRAISSSRSRGLSLVLAAAFVAVALAATARPAAAMVIPLSPEQQARLASSVALVDIGAAKVSGGRHLVRTTYALKTLETIKGSAPATVSVAGGVTPAFTEWVSDQPQLQPGHRYMLFLDKYGRAYAGVESAFPVKGGSVGPRAENVASFSARMKFWSKPPAYFKARGLPVPTPPAASAAPSGTAAEATPSVGSPQAAPVISAISADIVPADTNSDSNNGPIVNGSAVEIWGSGFGSTKGSVSFQYDPYAPSSTTFTDAKILSWTATRIVVQPEVFIDSTQYPGSAGSGPVTVRTSGGLTVTKSTTVSYGYNGAHWPLGSPVYFNVNPNGVNGSTSAAALAAVQGAFATWSNGGYPLTYGGASTVTNEAQWGASNSSAVFWNSTDLGGTSQGTLAVTGVDWSPTGVISDGFTEFNNNFTWVTSAPNGSQNKFDIQTIATHELGHTMHLLDKYGSGDTDQVMYGYNSGTIKRDLSFAEIEAARHVCAGDVHSPITSADGVPVSSVDSASVTLSGSDSDTDASDWGIRYRIDSGAATTYTAPLSFDTTGTYDLAYWGVDWAGNVETPHHATVVVGSGSGTITPPPPPATSTPVAFTPLGGSDRYKVAIGVSRYSFPSGTSDVVLATGAKFPDALTAAALAGAVDGPVLLTRPISTLSTDVNSEISRLLSGQPSPHIYIVGGTSSVASGIQSQLAARYGSSAIIRLGGADRYEVANNVARRLYAELQSRGRPTPGGAYMASGASAIDAVLTSPLAVHREWPLLLTGPTLKSSTQSTIIDLGLSEIDVVGPASRVSGSVESVLGLDAPFVYRVAAGVGSTDQSIQVADYATSLGMTRDGMGFASILGYNDALTAAPMLGKQGSVAYFLPANSLDTATSVYLSAHSSEVASAYFLGGIGSIPQTERDQVAAALRP